MLATIHTDQRCMEHTKKLNREKLHTQKLNKTKTKTETETTTHQASVE